MALNFLASTVHISPPGAIYLAAAALIAGGVNAIAGGGSLLSFPALLSVGYPALQANVTNTVALVPGYAGGSLAYRPELAGQRNRAIPLAVASLAGGLAGGVLLLVSPGSVFRAIVPWLILFSCLLLAVQPLVTNWVKEQLNSDEAPKSVQMLAQGLAAVYGGYF